MTRQGKLANTNKDTGSWLQILGREAGAGFLSLYLGGRQGREREEEGKDEQEERKPRALRV